MIDAAAGLPIIGCGTRAEVAFPNAVLVCRVERIQDGLVYLVAPSQARHSAQNGVGASVSVTFRGSQACWQAEAGSWTWIFRRTPLLVLGGLCDWRQTGIRDPRAHREVEAELRLPSGTYAGKTQDLSRNGVSLLVSGTPEISAGTRGSLALRTAKAVWRPEAPVCIRRVRNWLAPRGRLLQIGAELDTPSVAELTAWRQTLEGLGLEWD